MKKSNRLALYIGAGLVGLLISASAVNAQEKPKGKPWAAPAEEASKKGPKVTPDILKAGKELYNTNCKSCHGVKGKGDGEKAAKIEISCGDFTAADFNNESEGAQYYKITEGRKPMPSFKEKMSDAERWNVVAYIRSLKDAK